MIYLDNAATTYYKPHEVKQAVNTAINLYTANAGRGAHKLAQICAEKIYEVREKVLDLFKTQNHNVIFTSGCTAALNMAILGSVKKGGHVITTCLEHNSVLRPLQYLKSRGDIDYSVIESFSIEDFSRALKYNTYMVVTTLTSNVTGQKLDVNQINKWCKQHGLVHLVDTAQGAGHCFDNFNDIDMIAFAGHKGLYGIGGAGGLIVKNGMPLKPIMFGGTGTMSESLVQPTDIPEGFESGTLANIPIIALGAGIDYVVKNKRYILDKEEMLNRHMFDTLNSLDFITPYFNEQSKGVYSFNVLDYDSSFVSNYLNDRFNICTRPGLHCAPLIHRKLGTQDRGAVRVSISSDNLIEEIDVLKKALKKLYK